MVADGSAGRGKAEGGRQERTSGARDVCPGNAYGVVDGKSAGARRNRGDAGAADHVRANQRRDSCRGRRSVDGFFDKGEWGATCGRTDEHFSGRDAGEFEDRESPVHRTCALVAARFGDGSRFDRAAARGEGYECHWKCSRGFPPGRGAIAGADRGRASRAEEAAVVACNGEDADVPRRREPRAPGKEGGGAIDRASHARRGGGFVFYEGRENQFECGEWSGSGKSSDWSPADQPGGWHRRRDRGTGDKESHGRARRIQRHGRKIHNERRKSRDL